MSFISTAFGLGGGGDTHAGAGNFQDPMYPYYGGYAKSLSKLVNDPGSFQESPAAQYQTQQGMAAVQGGSAAKGMLNSGNTLSDLMSTSQGIASQDYYKQAGLLAGLGSGNPQYGQLYLNAQNQQFNQSTQEMNNWMNLIGMVAGA